MSSAPNYQIGPVVIQGIRFVPQFTIVENNQPMLVYRAEVPHVGPSVAPPPQKQNNNTGYDVNM